MLLGGLSKSFRPLCCFLGGVGVFYDVGQDMNKLLLPGSCVAGFVIVPHLLKVVGMLGEDVVKRLVLDAIGLNDDAIKIKHRGFFASQDGGDVLLNQCLIPMFEDDPAEATHALLLEEPLKLPTHVFGIRSAEVPDKVGVLTWARLDCGPDFFKVELTGGAKFQEAEAFGFSHLFKS